MKVQERARAGEGE